MTFTTKKQRPSTKLQIFLDSNSCKIENLFSKLVESENGAFCKKEAKSLDNFLSNFVNAISSIVLTLKALGFLASIKHWGGGGGLPPSVKFDPDIIED